MYIDDLDTPALLVDLDRLEANISRVANYARRHNLRLRPHTKTHKTPEIGRMQLDSGAIGLTVAKVSEAEPMLASGVEDLLIAYPVIGKQKLDRLLSVAKKTRVTVALDSPEAAEGLAAAASGTGIEVGVLVEANIGMDRTGREPGPPLIKLAQQVDALAGLRLDGFNFYPGHIWPPDSDGPQQLRRASEVVAQIRRDFDRAGLPCRIVSGGTTPTLFHSHEFKAVTEIRPGTAVFFDRMQADAGVCTLDDCAATILVTVVSAQSPERIIVDGGSKTFSSDPLRHSDDPTWGRIVDAPEARFHKMNEEHGIIDARRAGREFRVGDRLRILPNHICVAVNLHEKMHLVRGDRVEHTFAVRGRGKLQ